MNNFSFEFHAISVHSFSIRHSLNDQQVIFYNRVYAVLHSSNKQHSNVDDLVAVEGSGCSAKTKAGIHQLIRGIPMSFWQWTWSHILCFCGYAWTRKRTDSHGHTLNARIMQMQQSTNSTAATNAPSSTSYNKGKVHKVKALQE